MFILTTAKKMITLTCDKCGKEYEISEQQNKIRIKRNIPNYCRDCMREYSNQKKRDYYNNMSEEEKKVYNEKRNWYSRATDEQKEAYRQKMRNIQVSKTPEQLEEERRKNSEGLKRHWKTVSDEDKAKRIENMHIGNRERWDNMTPEERSKKASDRYWNLPDEERKRLHDIFSATTTKRNAETPMEVKLERVKAMQKWHANLTPEQKRELYQRTHAWWYKLDDNEKRKIADEKRAWYDNLSIEEKIAHRRNTTMPLHSTNSLHQKFEEMFKHSHLVTKFTLKPEDIQVNGDNIHAWDYGIYDTDDKLVMVVDIDGEMYHGVRFDYDGNWSREYLDESRSLSVPDGIKIFIIPEGTFTKSFELMLQTLIQNYDDYVDEMFKMYRTMGFPDIEYSDNELRASYNQLISLDCNDKMYYDISINTRAGDKIIQNYHKSIYRAHRKGKISPYEAWQNDDMLRQCIKNRIVYQTYLNPKKILQGFNISRIAPKVSVFSAGRARLLINKYLSDYDTIFDPFSGFSGRLLGAVSLEKRYIGQDISDIHVAESNQIIDFLNSNRYNVIAEVHQADSSVTTGTYQCLFTCPPYSDKEVWLDVPVDLRTCDDWIDICLKNYNCKRYLFVVDKTEKYKDNIAYELRNRSHVTDNIEYVICIDR